MKIIILNDFAHITGGAEQVAISSSIGLAKKGYDVTLFTMVGPIDDSLKNIENLKVICLNQYDILHDPKRWRAIINGLWNFSAASKFKELLLTMNSNNTIIHVHAISKALTTSCIKTAMDLNFKIIYHMHDYGLGCPNLGFFHYPKQEICTLKPLSYQCMKTNCDKRSYYHKIWRCLRHWIQFNIGQVPKKIKNFVYISNFSINILKHFLPFGSKQYLVSNPINITKNDIVKVDQNKNYVFLGRLTPEKNPEIFAKVANELQIQTIFIGNGSCEEKIKKLCPNAKITGWLDSEEIDVYLQEARVLVFPSAWYEGQPLAVLEAIGRGIPVIVSDTCAAQESFIDGKSGLLFKNNDATSLKEALMKMQDDQVVRNMGQIAYTDFWKKENDMNRYIQNIIKIYREILSQ